MQTRNVAVCDQHGNRLKTYAIAIPQRKDGPLDDEFAEEALRRAREDSLVPNTSWPTSLQRCPRR